MRLNLSDQPLTAELLAEGLARSGSAQMTVNGTSMHPTLQMGWRIYLRPLGGEPFRPGDIYVFRGEHHLTVHRLVFIEGPDDAPILVFRGDHNRVRERVAPAAVLARVSAVEVPGARRGFERVIALETDSLALLYLATWRMHRLLRPLLPKPAPPGTPPSALGRAGRRLFAFTEKCLSVFLPQKR